MQVTLVRWNEPYQKLASCDTSGIIFVWIKYEGRWSIELINDRSTPVICFAWSHDGRMALICYQVSFPDEIRYMSKISREESAETATNGHASGTYNSSFNKCSLKSSKEKTPTDYS